MQRSCSVFILAISVSLILILTACGGGGSSSSSSSSTSTAVGSVDLEPANVTIDQGAVFQMGARVLGTNGRQIFSISPTFSSSNSGVASIANNGLLCGGTWDSLTNPVVCTAGPVGTAVITATANGVTSNSVTVFVHNHIVKLTIAPTDADTCKSANANAGAAHAEIYDATAYNASNVDITSTVGNISWAVQSGNVAKLLTSASNAGLAANQAQLQAAIPGATELTANVSNVTGSLTSSGNPLFVTCPPAKILLAVNGGGTIFTEGVGASTTLNQGILDTRGFDISTIPLTISSSWPGVIQRGSLTEAGAAPGTTEFVASCTPPLCNTNINQPIYSNIVIGNVSGNPSDTTLWVGSTQFPTSPEGNPAAQIIPVALTGFGQTATSGSPINLPHVPNSMVSNIEGNTLYMGSASGLMEMDENSNTVNTVTNAPGIILAVARGGRQVVLADPVGNDVNIFDSGNSTVTTAPIPFNANMSASYSVDDFRLYVTSGSTLYVLTPTLSIKTIAAPGTVVSTDFLANGSFAYMALSGGGVAVNATCDLSFAASASTNSAPQLITRVWDGSAMVAVDQTGIDKLDTTITPGGCPPPVPPNSDTFIDFGAGTFTAKQMIVTPDSKKVYVLPAGVNQVYFADLTTNTPGTIPLVGTGTGVVAEGVLQASSELYVLTSGDNALHVVATDVNQDHSQVGISFPACGTCAPNLLAVRPK
jgi:hypothetical protein